MSLQGTVWCKSPWQYERQAGGADVSEKSPKRLKANPSWFSWKNTKDVVYWKGDLKPCFAYTVRKILGFEEGVKKRQH